MTASDAHPKPEVQPVSKTVVANLADRLARSGNTLGLQITTLSEGPAHALINSKPVTRDVAQKMDALNVDLADVAYTRAAKESGRSFIGRFGSAGLMLSSPTSSPGPHAEQMARVANASPEELQHVARINAKQYMACVDEEAGLRLDQAALNHPKDYAKRLLDTSGGKTVEGNRASLIEDFKKLDYQDQRTLSARDGAVVTLPLNRSRFMAAIKRGYAAIDKELTDRGLRVEVKINGRDNVAREKASQSFVEAANAPAMANRSRRSRDGVSLG